MICTVIPQGAFASGCESSVFERLSLANHLPGEHYFGVMRPRTPDRHAEALHEFAEWEWHFSQVAEFVRERGHCDLGSHPAAAWLRRQRTAAVLGKLSPERQQRLSDLGIRLVEDDASWDATLERLREWGERQGVAKENQTTLPPGNPADADLLDWLGDQRLLSAAGKLSARQKSRLARIKIRPPSPEQPSRSSRRFAKLWEKRFAQMVSYQKAHGHTRVPKSYDKKLCHWRHVQREFRRKGMLSADRIASLDAIGFEWERPGRNGRDIEVWKKERWDELFTRLTTFKERFGHCQVPVKWAEDDELAGWTCDQRKAAKSGRMIAERRQRLDEIGFAWKASYRINLPPFSSQRAPSAGYIKLWETRFAQITAYQKEHGHTRVPKSFDKKLWHWRDVQRQFRRKGMLSAERIARLDSIGFEWERPDGGGRNRDEYNAQRWDFFFHRLVAFKERFGHCQVPKGYIEDTALATWVNDQRKRGKKNELPEDRRRCLDEIGFVWMPQVQRSPAEPKPYAARTLMRISLWDERRAALAAYQQQHGHTRIPYGENEVLANWCSFQRERRRRGTLPADRIASLDAIDFEWDRPSFNGLEPDDWRRQRWDYFFGLLTAFKKRFGHCQVPMGWVEDKKLAQWVASQRKGPRSGHTPADRKQRLDAIGFEWKPLTRPTRRGKRPPPA